MSMMDAMEVRPTGGIGSCLVWALEEGFMDTNDD